MTAIPPSLKQLVSTIKRAEELEKSSNREERVVAYYCRLYAVTKTLSLVKAPNAEENKFINDQMVNLEQLKPSLNLSGDEGKRICIQHANAVFNKADDVDRSGMADKGIAKLFYAAGTFFDILEQFGDLDKETQEKKKYAKWKATDILNAINSGALPTPGGFEKGGATPSDEAAPSAPLSLAPPSTPIYPSAAATPPAADSSLHIPSPPVRQPSSIHAAPLILPSAGQPIYPAAKPSASKPSAQSALSPAGPQADFIVRGRPINNADPRVKDAGELCSFALTAIKFNDIPLARERLQEALRLLS